MRGKYHRKLTANEVKAIRAEHGKICECCGKVTNQRDLARKYNVSYAEIYKIVRGIDWKDI